MDFFAVQDQSRRKTKWLVLYYCLAVIAIIGGIYFALVLALGSFTDLKPAAPGLYPELLVGTILVTTMVIGGGSLFKTVELRAGGEQVAAALGGKRIHPATNDFKERQLLNVVEEMALAAGVPVPPVYIIEKEPGINAFAAGYSPSDAVIGVNRGTVEQLSRDELQGVIAHEFSHILNGDMRMNIRLIGVLFGIQILTMIGYFIFRTVGYAGSGRSNRSNRDGGGGQAVLVILAVGGALVLFGLIGQFFASLIKASVSRQREYLADASAVQFTRNPDGIAGALKMIGASAAGSKLESWQAAEISHMFFASCFSSSLTTAFATHPPLVPRIQRIDQQFDGDFEGYVRVREARGRAQSRRLAKEAANRERLEQLSPLGAMLPAQIAEKFSIDPTLLLATIGSPDQRDVQRSRKLLEAIDANITAAARDPFQARCVAFAMLASEVESLRYEQMRLIAKNEGQASLDLTRQLLPAISNLPLVYRLPLMEMLQASLSEMSPQQYQQFRKTVGSLVQLDNQTSLFEFAVRHHLLMHLDRRFKVGRQPRVRFHSTAKLEKQIELMLSAFASASASGSVLQDTIADPASITKSYRLAMQVAGFSEAAVSQAELSPWEVEQLEQSMQDLQCASPAVKKQFLHAAAVLITFDHEITIAESEFFRAVAESLDCPVPVLAAGRTRRAKLELQKRELQ